MRFGPASIMRPITSGAGCNGKNPDLAQTEV